MKPKKKKVTFVVPDFQLPPLCYTRLLRSSTSGELPKPNNTTPAVTPPPPTVQPHNCPDGQFVCVAYGECVSNSKVCDFRQDCSDGSDEFNCGKIITFSPLRSFLTAVKALSYLHQHLLPCFLFLSVFLSEGKVWFWRRGHLWLAERRLHSVPDEPISLDTWSRGEHPRRRGIPPADQRPHPVSASETNTRWVLKLKGTIILLFTVNLLEKNLENWCTDTFFLEFSKNQYITLAVCKISLKKKTRC